MHVLKQRGWSENTTQRRTIQQFGVTVATERGTNQKRGRETKSTCIHTEENK